MAMLSPLHVEGDLEEERRVKRDVSRGVNRAASALLTTTSTVIHQNVPRGGSHQGNAIGRISERDRAHQCGYNSCQAHPRVPLGQV